MPDESEYPGDASEQSRDNPQHTILDTWGEYQSSSSAGQPVSSDFVGGAAVTGQYQHLLTPGAPTNWSPGPHSATYERWAATKREDRSFPTSEVVAGFSALSATQYLHNGHAAAFMLWEGIPEGTVRLYRDPSGNVATMLGSEWPPKEYVRRETNTQFLACVAYLENESLSAKEAYEYWAELETALQPPPWDKIVLGYADTRNATVDEADRDPLWLSEGISRDPFQSLSRAASLRSGPPGANQLLTAGQHQSAAWQVQQEPQAGYFSDQQVNLDFADGAVTSQHQQPSNPSAPTNRSSRSHIATYERWAAKKPEDREFPTRQIIAGFNGLFELKQHNGHLAAFILYEGIPDGTIKYTRASNRSQVVGTERGVLEWTPKEYVRREIHPLILAYVILSGNVRAHPKEVYSAWTAIPKELQPFPSSKVILGHSGKIWSNLLNDKDRIAFQKSEDIPEGVISYTRDTTAHYVTGTMLGWKEWERGKIPSPPPRSWRSDAASSASGNYPSHATAGPGNPLPDQWGTSAARSAAATPPPPAR